MTLNIKIISFLTYVTNKDFKGGKLKVVVVLIQDRNRMEMAIRIFRKKAQKEGIIREAKRRKEYEKPSEKKKRKKQESQSRIKRKKRQNNA